MNVSATFLDVTSFNPQSMGMGSKMTMTSMMVSVDASALYKTLLLPQRPGVSGIQLFRGGMQTKTSLNRAAM